MEKSGLDEKRGTKGDLIAGSNQRNPGVLHLNGDERFVKLDGFHGVDASLDIGGAELSCVAKQAGSSSRGEKKCEKKKKGVGQEEDGKAASAHDSIQCNEWRRKNCITRVG